MGERWVIGVGKFQVHGGCGDVSIAAGIGVCKSNPVQTIGNRSTILMTNKYGHAACDRTVRLVDGVQVSQYNMELMKFGDEVIDTCLHIIHAVEDGCYVSR